MATHKQLFEAGAKYRSIDVYAHDAKEAIEAAKVIGEDYGIKFLKIRSVEEKDEPTATESRSIYLVSGWAVRS
jgi:hypothetical protein